MAKDQIAKATKSVEQPQGSTSESTAKHTMTKRKLEDVSTPDAKKARASPARSTKATPAPESTKSAKSSEKQAKPRAATPKVKKARKIINNAPTQKFELYVVGINTGGELGIGRASVEGRESKILPNGYLNAAGVVQCAVGGMHSAALTHDNKILTWGVGDEGQLGRNSYFKGDSKKAGEPWSTAEEELRLNPYECKPKPINASELPEDTVFTQVVAGDNATYALTDEGLVYGWGTIRGNNCVIGFSPETKIVRKPQLVPELKRVVKLAAGSNHYLALTNKGAVLTWGACEHNQLGRRIVERTRMGALRPREFGLPRGIVDIAAGAEHSFALHKNGKVYAWGFNNFCQTGDDEEMGMPSSVTSNPTVVQSLLEHKIVSMAAGYEHSVFVTEKGECLSWGRITNHALGLDFEEVDEDGIMNDATGTPALLMTPTAIPGFKAVFATAKGDTSLAITKEGRAWSWGYNDCGQTGADNDDEDVLIPKPLQSSALKGKKVVWAGLGVHFCVLGAVDR